ncbi:hypothetical protein Tsubulata_042231 [Turnera subulata]|uniref:Protein MIZU-KUSSEI 1 n=1 Tax=Turnera subulata TaxID=218843 RepID=A0A9Q0F816_9ROSI|nr:hypothetical protein Tsubulata_042231 [Turnera subulata]
MKNKQSPEQAPLPKQQTNTSPSASPPPPGSNAPKTPPRPPPAPTVSLRPATDKKGNRSKPVKMFRRFRNVFRSFPIIAPVCRFPVALPGTRTHNEGHIQGGTRLTGTLFGHKKSRVNFAIQEAPSSLPILLLELTITTGKLLQDMGSGLVRIALECEKKPNEKTKVVDEPIWTLFFNGRKSGYAVKREPTDDDLAVMQLLHVVSMGAAVLPSDDGNGTEHPDGELTYMRAYFERVIGSKDSETYYMMSPDGHNGPELTIFFVRI